MHQPLCYPCNQKSFRGKSINGRMLRSGKGTMATALTAKLQSIQIFYLVVRGEQAAETV